MMFKWDLGRRLVILAMLCMWCSTRALATGEYLPPQTFPTSTFAANPPAGEDTPARAAGDVYLLFHSPVINNAWVYKFDRETPAASYTFPQNLLFTGNPGDLFGISADRTNFVYTLHLTYRDSAARDITPNLLNYTSYGDKVLQIDPGGNESYITVTPGSQTAQSGYAYLPPPCNIVHPSFQADNVYIITENVKIYHPYHNGIMGQLNSHTNAARNIDRGLVQPTTSYIDRNFTMDLTQNDSVLNPQAGPTHSVRLYLNCLCPVLGNTNSLTAGDFYLSSDNQYAPQDILPHPNMTNPALPLTDSSGLWYSVNTSAHWVSHFAAKRYTGGFTIQKTSYGAQRYNQGTGPSQAAIGPSLAASVNLGFNYFKRSSCGEGCLNGPATNSGGIQQDLPSRMFFASTGGANGLNGLAYSIRNNAIVEQTLNASNQWTYPTGNSGNWFALTPTGYTNTANIMSLGVADKDTGQAWVYYTLSVPQNYFTVASRFFRDGGIVFTYDPNPNEIAWNQYIGSQAGIGGRVAMPNLSSGSRLEAITADGLGNLAVLRSTTNPPGIPGNFAGTYNSFVAPDYDAVTPVIDQNNPNNGNPFVAGVGATRPGGDGYTYRDVVLNQFLTYDLSHITLDTLQQGSTSWANSNPVARGTVSMPPLRLTRPQVQTGANTWAWSGPAVYDAPDTVIDYSGSFRLELASVNVTEPPLIAGTTIPDISSLNRTGGTGQLPSDPETITEDTTKTFDLENAPRFNWLSAGPLGVQNSSFNATDTDGDGVAGSFISSIVNPWTSDLSMISGSAGLTKNISWQWTITNQSLMGQATYSPTVVTGSASANGVESTGNLNTSCGYRFKDPGSYRIDFSITYLQWTAPPSLTVDSTVTNLGLIPVTKTATHYVRVLANQQSTDYVRNIQTTGADRQIMEDNPGPAGIPLTSAHCPSGTVGNWVTSADLYFYRGINYNYYQTTGNTADIGSDVIKQSKYNGVGMWDWSHPDKNPGAYTCQSGTPKPLPAVTDPVPVNYCDPDNVINDGLPRSVNNPATAQGTLSDESRYSQQDMVLSNESEYDWYEIKYYWFMRYRDPNTGDYVIPANNYVHAAAPKNDGNDGKTYQLIREGNLSEIWALERASRAGVLNQTYKNGLLNATCNSQPFLSYVPVPSGVPVTDRNGRHYQVRIPLFKPTLLNTTSKLGGAQAKLISAAKDNATFPVAGLERYSFQVPCDPSAIELVCRIEYPKVKWVQLKENNAITTNVQYYTLVSDSTAYGTYLHGDTSTLGPTNPEIGATVGKYASDGADGGIIDFTVLDNQPPKLRYGTVGAGTQQNGEFFDGSQSQITVSDNNPYQHWKAAGPGTPGSVGYGPPAAGSPAAEIAFPALTFFAYEVGIDRRDTTNGLGFAGNCLGFDLGARGDSLISPVDDTPLEHNKGRQNPLNWSFNTFENGQGAHPILASPYSGNRNSPGSLGNRRVQPLFMVDEPSASDPSDINHMYVLTSSCASNVVTPAASGVGSPGSEDTLVWFKSNNDIIRSSAWRPPVARMSLALFSKGGDAVDEHFLIFAQGKDQHPYDTSTNKVSLDDDANQSNNASCVGRMSLADISAPHLRVTLTDSRTAIPRVYTVYPEYARTPGTANPTPPIRVLISSDATRPIYDAQHLNITRLAYDNHGAANQLKNGPTTHDITIDLQSANPVGGTQAWPLDTVGAYYIEANTTLLLMVEAMDNISNQDVVVNVRSVPVAEGSVPVTTGLPASNKVQDPFPDSKPAEDTVPKPEYRKALVRLEHKYVLGNAYDLIEVKARDLAGNTTIIRLPVITVPTDSSIRQIGVSGQ